MRKTAVIFLLIGALFSLCSCSEKVTESQRFVFGTICTITVYGNVKDLDAVFNEVWDRMSLLENRISNKIETSTVEKLNSGLDVSLDLDTSYLLETGERFEKLTGGAFSPYLGALTKLWAIGTEEAKVPSKSEIFMACQKHLIDLGALGKGYASDLAREILVKHGVNSAIINFGGNICCIGSKVDGSDYIIGLQDPDSKRGIYKKTVNVKDMCVVTSGNYERFFEKDGKRYCHIFDGRTSYPVDNGLKSVSIIGKSGLICDALSTCCFILGESESQAVLEHFPEYKVLF